ncbi:hypothetical protein ZIOFF_041505 [Zingiber officinale]|uniref:CCHC-type domain-containing protein n=1 Tax=Zingiber officinale TaxID=94328 RepID=A0A8J5GDT9_ZINOF|nr:hypothetical protein ZIOFF_041505 [Zingiber officinale]
MTSAPTGAPPTFDSQNYAMWAVKMKTFLKGADLWSSVKSDAPPAELRENPTVQQQRFYTEENAKKYKALSMIHAAVSETIFIRIMDCEIAKGAWDRLSEEFQGSIKTKQMQVLNLRREFELIRMTEVEVVKDFVDRLMKIVNQIRLLGESMPDARVVEKVLVSLPEKFESKISSLEDSRDLSQISIAELVNSLQAVELRKENRIGQATETTLVAKFKGKAQVSKFKGNFNNNNEKKGKKEEFQRNFQSDLFCSKCNRKGHLEKFCRSKAPAKCWNCNKLGHLARDCRNKSQPQNSQVKRDDQEVEEIALMAKMEVHKTVEGKEDTWLLDSGCTHHMTPNGSLFDTVHPCNFLRVRMGDGKLVHVQGKGNIEVPTLSGTKTKFTTLYVPDLHQGLISIGQLLEDDYDVHFFDKKCEIRDAQKNLIVVVKMVDRSFPINWGEVLENVNRTESKAVEGKTPYEAWFDKNPQVGHLKIFGSPCYAWVPKMRRDKLDSRADICIFVGYSLHSKGYRLYNIESQKIIVARDVKVDEHSIWNLEDKKIIHAVTPVLNAMQDEDEEDEEVNQPKLILEEDEDNIPIRGTRSLSDIYERCNVAVEEPSCFEEAYDIPEWEQAMKQELEMIEKNGTSNLVDRPSNRKIYGQSIAWTYGSRKENLEVLEEYQNPWNSVSEEYNDAIQCFNKLLLDVINKAILRMTEKEKEKEKVMVVEVTLSKDA